MMTDIICVRPIVLEEKGETKSVVAYGRVVDYSVLEYVKTAKGEFDGIPAISNAAHLDLLDSMLDFGATAQIYLGGDEPYGDFLATDEVHKIWVTPIIGGVERTKVFAGFFKYEEGDTVQVYPPHYDGLSAINAYDAEGNLNEEFIIGSNVPVASVDSDIEIKVEYDTHVIRQIDIEGLGVGTTVNSVNQKAEGGNNVATFSKITNVGLGSKVTANLSGASTPDAAKYRYHGFKVVADPENESNAYLQWTATEYSQFGFSYIGGNDYSSTGFGDTVYPSITIEMSIGRVGGKLINTDWFMIRHRQTGAPVGVEGDGTVRDATNIQVFKFAANGDIIVANGIGTDGKPVPEVIGTVAEEGFTRVAIVIDTRAEKYHCYVENANGEMEYITSTDVARGASARWALYTARRQEVLTDDDPSNDDVLKMYDSLEAWFKYSSLENGIFGGKNWKTEYDSMSVEIDGEMVPVKDPATGLYNLLALQAKAEETCSLLFDDYRIVIGDVYGATYD